MRTKPASLLFVSWVGDSDLLAWAANELPWADNAKLRPGEQQLRILDGLKGDAFSPEKQHTLKDKVERLRKALNWRSSVIVGLTEAVERHSSITAVLMSNLEAKVVRTFSEWLAGKLAVKVQFEPFHFESGQAAMSYKESYDWVEKQIGKVGKHEAVWFNLTAGSSAMTTALVLLGKLGYPDEGAARFVMVQNGILVDCPIPLNLIEIWNSRQDDLKRGAADYSGIIGSSQPLRKALESANIVAPYPDNVLLLGPSGSGKELFARHIHAASGRKADAFVAVNCAILSPERLESELFGHVKGAFTGASNNRNGKALSANGGTLFLDEIGECPLPVQAQLLRFLQPNEQNRLLREVVPMGSDSPVSPKPEIRIISATNRNLLRRVQEGKFREDLYWRLADWTIELPPLSERRQDIPQLSAHFLNERPILDGFPRPQITMDAMSALSEFNWPGNVRQLKLVVGRLAIHAGKTGLITGADVARCLAQDIQNSSPDQSDDKTLDELLNRVQRYWIEKALIETGGNRKEAAKLLGLNSGQTLSNRLSHSASKINHSTKQTSYSKPCSL